MKYAQSETTGFKGKECEHKSEYVTLTSYVDEQGKHSIYLRPTRKRLRKGPEKEYEYAIVPEYFVPHVNAQA